MVQIDIEYTGDLRCVATHGPSGATLITDAPTDNHGQGRSFSPTDLAATSLGVCVMTIMAIAALKHPEIDLRETKIQVTKVMSTEPPRRIARLPVTITFAKNFTAKQRAFLENAASGCPVHRSFSPDVDITLKFVYPS